ncbi:MAG: insulinase family protein [Pseudoruegeria sp.]
MYSPFRAAFVCIALFSLTACKDDTNRVISQHTSTLGYEFTLMPITESRVTDVTIAAAWSSDWMLQTGRNEWVPGLGVDVMLTGGTTDLPPADIANLLEEKNSWGNIYVTSDYIYGEVEFPNNYADDVLPVLADLFQRPAFDQAWFDRIQSQRMEAASGDEKTVGALMWDASRVALLGNTPQLAFQNGTDTDALRSATLDDVKTWHSASFAYRPAAIVVTGAIDAQAAGDAIDQLFAAPGAAPLDPKPLLSPLDIQATTIFLHLPEVEKSTIGVIGLLPPITDNSAGVDMLAINLFGGGADSPLFTAIRTDLGATYRMGVEIAPYSRSQRALVISGEIETDKMADARDAIITSYTAFRTAPDLRPMPDFAARFADSVRQDNVSVSSSAFTIRELMLQGRDPQDYHVLASDFEAITEVQMQARLTNAFPASNTLMVFGAGPDASVFPEACVITHPSQTTQCLD